MVAQLARLDPREGDSLGGRVIEVPRRYIDFPCHALRRRDAGIEVRCVAFSHSAA